MNSDDNDNTLFMWQRQRMTETTLRARKKTWQYARHHTISTFENNARPPPVCFSQVSHVREYTQTIRTRIRCWRHTRKVPTPSSYGMLRVLLAWNNAPSYGRCCHRNLNVSNEQTSIHIFYIMDCMRKRCIPKNPYTRCVLWAHANDVSRRTVALPFGVGTWPRGSTTVYSRLDHLETWNTHTCGYVESTPLTRN